MSKLFGVTMAVGLVVVMLVALNGGLVWAATPPEPTYGTADVDGNDSEWDLPNDFFANMYQGGDPKKDILSKLYLRYDCSTETLYALVRAEDDVDIEALKSEEHWIRIDEEKEVDDTYGNDGTPPDFAWIGRSGNYAQGWEASAAPLTQGSYTLKVHTQVDEQIGEPEDDQTSSTGNIALKINCVGSIGDYVWNDVNRDGIQDSGESGINGVVVELYKDGSLLQTTTTANAPVTGKPGWYIFTGLAAGNYIVKVADSNFDSSGALYDYLPAVPNAVPDDTVDSDGDPITHEAAVTLASGENNMTIDFGFSDCEIGDRVWHDQNDDGLQTGTFDQEGLNGVDVYLYYDFNPSSCGMDGYLYKTTTISGTSKMPDDFPNGIYGFDMSLLGLGTYWVCVDEKTLPDPGVNMQWARTTANPQQVNYAGGDDFSIDFGYITEGVPTAVTLSSFAARSSAGGWANPLWLGFAGLTVLAAGLWAKRRSR